MSRFYKLGPHAPRILSRMSKRATGPFDVEATYDPPYDTADGTVLGRATFHKSFHGELEAQSVVQMLYAKTATEGSGAYVAIERVRGTLTGKAGSFVLDHRGTMDRGASSLVVSVVPDSATGELTGLRGTMRIDIVEGQHSYVFDYELG